MLSKVSDSAQGEGWIISSFIAAGPLWGLLLTRGPRIMQKHNFLHVGFQVKDKALELMWVRLRHTGHFSADLLNLS